jgi:hypothetical protein
MPDSSPLPKWLSQFGLSKTLQRIKFGGVVGKQTLLGIFAVLGLASLGWRASQGDILSIAVIAAIVVLAIAFLNFRYAHSHPAEATLEGTEMLALQHQVMASKFIEPPKDSTIVPNPGGSPPQSNPPGEAEK